MQLTERDVRILRLVADFRYMTREQVEKLEFSPTTISYCKRRLSLLFHNGYLERRFLPLRGVFGAARAYYVLDQRGTGVLMTLLALTRAELDWRPRDGRREPLYMEHTLRINDMRVLLILAARRAALELRWIDERELKRRARDHRVPDPLHLNERITIIPDGYFTLGNRWSFALELDRGTVEEVPFKRKVRGYGEWKTSGLYTRSFGTSSLRVLFVVADSRRDPHRISRIRRWTQSAGGGSMFWFAALEELGADALLFEPEWIDASREGRRSLLDRTVVDGLERPR
jgi:hypothetical protein